jgi:hypothetical protein
MEFNSVDKLIEIKARIHALDPQELSDHAALLVIAAEAVMAEHRGGAYTIAERNLAGVLKFFLEPLPKRP